jgi:signal transduction histidine kinase
MQAMGMHHPYWRMIAWGLAIGNMWSFITPIVLYVSKKFPLEKPRFLSSIAVHLAVAAVLCFVTAMARTAITMSIHPFDPLTSLDPYWLQFRKGLLGAVPYVLFLYVAVAGVGYAIEYRRVARERAIRAAQLEALLSQAQVLSLKMQLHPHFLFNTLNGIATLVREGDGENAVKMLLGLSNMLRYALDSSGRQEVPLSEEIEFLNLYLGVEQMRFPDRLKIEMDIANDTEQALVPSLMLQPLVENAIRHGLAPRVAPGTVRVRSRRDGDSLVLDVEDDGVGLSSETSTSGIGLQNTRSRLAQLYQSGCELKIGNREHGGVEVRLVLPFRTASAEPLRA